MSRRWNHGLLHLTALFACIAPAHASAPNILFVLVDDMGWGDLGVFYQNSRNFAANRNAPAFSTPRLDTMAAEGMQLRRHYCPAPVCAPSRASLILGVHQGHANIRDNQFDKALEDNHTLPGVLRQAGYATAIFGKWGLQGTGTPPAAHPQNRGFDYFYGYMAHEDGHHHYPKENGYNVWDGLATANLNDLDKCYTTDLWTARTKKWMVDHQAANPSQPFFIYLAYDSPHAQLQVPTSPYPSGGGTSGGMRWLGTPGAMITSATGTIDSWIHPDYSSATYDHDNNSSTAEIAWPDYAKRHATMIRRLDDAMADLIQTLKDLNIDNNTLIVFTSDNGPHNEAGTGGSYTQNPTFFDSFGPMDGIKRDTWEGGMREPTLVRWPGHIPAGGISSAASQFQDWMPTLAEAAGIPAPARTDGVSLLPTLTGSGTQRESTIYVEYQYSGSTPSYTEFESSRRGATRGQEQVIHLDGYKGIRYNIAAATDDFQIYNTLTDAKETTNLAGTSAYFISLQQRMKDRVLQVRRPGGGVTRPYDSASVPSVNVSPTIAGLNYRAFEDSYPWVPDFTPISGATNGNCSGIDLSVRTRNDQIGLLYTGYLNVPADGSYTFYLNTDGKAFLRLHDAGVIDADFGYTGGTERSTTLNLKAGLHPLKLGYVRGTGGSPALSLQWSGPSIAKQQIPSANLVRQNSGATSPPTATPDNASTTSTTPVIIPVLANDMDDGTPSPLSITSVGTPAGGTAAISGNSITYTARSGFYGDDAFAYTISDGQQTATSTVTVTVSPSSTTVWLPLDETAGTTAKNAMGNPIGTLTNFPTSPWTAGKLANALAFDGIDDRVVLTGYKGITGTAARTVTFWLNADATQTSGTRPTMVSWGANNSSTAGVRFDINLNHTGGYKLRAEFNSSGIDFSTPSRSDLRGAGWVHCAIVMPAGATVSQVLGYLDGVAATGTATSGTTAINTGNTNDVSLGRIADSTASRVLAGKLDDVRIYPRALSAAEVAALASQTPDQNLQSQWFYRYSGNESPALADWQADTDGDGYNARMEFALGGNPTLSSTSITPFLSGVPQFAFNRRQTGIAASSYVPEISENLNSWSPLGALSAIPHPNLAGFDLVTVTLPPSSLAHRFVRLRLDP